MRTIATCCAFLILSIPGCFSDEVVRSLAPGGSTSTAGASPSAGAAGASLAGAPAGASGSGGTPSGGTPSDDAGAPPANDAGSGGSAGSVAGSGGSAGAVFVVDKTKPDLLTVGGQVLESTNGFGVQGTWMAFHADTAQVTGSFVGTNVCVQGTFPKVPNDTQWPAFWGGGISLILSSPTAGGLAVPYNAPAHQFAGVAVTVTGPTIPHEIRLKYKQFGSNDSYCKAFFNVKSGDRLRVLVSEVTRECWNPGGAHVVATNLEHFELHVWPELAGDLPMDLCLSNLSVIAVGDEGVGGAGGAGGASGAAGTGGASAGSGGVAGADAGSGGAVAGSAGATSGGVGGT